MPDMLWQLHDGGTIIKWLASECVWTKKANVSKCAQPKTPTRKTIKSPEKKINKAHLVVLGNSESMKDKLRGENEIKRRTNQRHPQFNASD